MLPPFVEATECCSRIHRNLFDAVFKKEPIEPASEHISVAF